MRSVARVILWIVPILLVAAGAVGLVSGRCVAYRRGLVALRAPDAGPADSSDASAVTDERPRSDEAAGAAIAGVVRRGGAPIGGAEVVLFETIDATEPYAGPWGAELPEVVTEALPSRRLTAVRSGPDGAWRFDGLAAGRYCVIAGSPDDPAAPRAARIVTLPPGGLAPTEEIALPEGPGSVTLRVRGLDGRPFAGRVAVRARPFLELRDVLVVAQCDADGRAVISGLAQPCWSLWALADDGAERGPDLDVPVTGGAPAAHVAWDLAAPLRRIVVECVRAEDGGPVAGAAVRVRDGVGQRVFRTGDDGRAVTFAGWAATVDVRAPGRTPQALPFHGAPPEEPMAIRVPRSGAVAGTVADVRDATPVAGAVVWAGPPGDPETPHARTAADGSFRIDDCGPGRVRLHVLGGGWTNAADGIDFRETVKSRTDNLGSASQSVRFLAGDAAVPWAEIVAGETAVVRLAVERSARFAGRVTDADGAPVAGARLLFRDRVAERFDYELGAITGADGRFSTAGVRAFDQPFCVAWGAGVPPRIASAGDLVAPGGTGLTRILQMERLEIALPRGRAVFCVVRDADGAPVAGSAVRLQFVDPRLVRTVTATAITDERGAAQLSPVEATSSSLEASAPGLPDAASGTLDLASSAVGSAAFPVELVMARVERRRGVVVADGAPVAGAVVRYTGTGARCDGSLRTDDRGEFELPAAAGAACAVSVHAPRGMARVAEFAAPDAGSSPVRVELANPPPPASPEPGDSVPPAVVLTGPAGEPVPNFRWMRWSAGHDESRDDDSSDLELFEFRDEFGALLRLDPVRVRLGEGSARGREVRLAAGDRGTVRGRLVDDGGQPVEGAVVGVFATEQMGVLSPEDAIAAAHSAADGSFLFRGMPAGELVVRATHIRTGAAASLAVGDARGAGGLTLRMSAADRVAIRVVDGDGLAVPGAVVGIRIVDQQFVCLNVRDGDGLQTGPSRRTGADGIARFPEVARGTSCFVLSVDPPASLRGGVSWFRLSPWTAEDATITLR